MTEPEYYIKDPSGNWRQVLEVYESFTGWYWYIIEIDKDDPDVAFGFVQGFEDEWGDIYLPEIKSQKMVWSVPKKNWSWTGKNTPMKTAEYILGLPETRRGKK